jgi:hypothetical protein
MSDVKNGTVVGMGALAATAGIHVADVDAQPVVVMGPDLNVVARRLGEVAGRLELFEMADDLVFFDHEGRRRLMTARTFRTWIGDFVVIAGKFDKASGEAVPVTMGIEDAGTILECVNFRRGVRKLRGVNAVRLPVVRADGRLELLPWGYDEETEMFTVRGGVEYDMDMDVECARGWVRRLFGGFPFANTRSEAVQVAALLALFVKHLPGAEGLRPGFLWLANKPESGKSVLAKAALYPVLGTAAAAKMKKGEELDKELEAFCRAAVPYIFLDNVYGGIQSASIDQLLTSEESTGRGMGGHGVFLARNTALLLVTGNRLELNEDAARRFLVVDLFEKGDPGDRAVAEADVLDDGRMKGAEWRGLVLSVCWAFVRNWHGVGMPRGSVVLGSFENFSRLLGGVVEAGGYSPPFERAEIPDAISPERAEFVELLGGVLEEMGLDVERDFTLEDLARLARARGLFGQQVGSASEGKKLTVKEDGLDKNERAFAEDRGYMTPAQRSAFGKRMGKEAGTTPKVGGRVVEVGKRAQSRKSTFTMRVVG